MRIHANKACELMNGKMLGRGELLLDILEYPNMRCVSHENLAFVSKEDERIHEWSCTFRVR